MPPAKVGKGQLKDYTKKQYKEIKAQRLKVVKKKKLKIDIDLFDSYFKYATN